MKRRKTVAELLLFPEWAVPVRETVREIAPPDAAERARALDIRASWIVEAPAGSGKTGLLIQRFLKLLADPGVEAPEQVLAITFTIAATGEMRDRVLGQLQAAADGTAAADGFEGETRPLAEAVLRRGREAGWALLEQPRRLNIRTIDSVCAEIARSLPVLSGTGGRLAPTLDASGLFQEAARRTLGQLGGADERLSGALGSLLLHRDGNLADCERLIAAMLEWRDQWGQLIPLTGDALEDAALDAVVLPRLQRAVELAICQGLTELARTISSADLRDLTEAGAELAHLDGYKGAPSPIALCAGRNEPPEERAEHLAHWRALVGLVVTKSGEWRKGFQGQYLKFEVGKAHAERLRVLVARLCDNGELLKAMCRLGTLPPAEYPAEQWAVAKVLFRVLGHALVELQLVFAEEGQCDFAELGLAARAALARDSGADDLAAALGVETRHLLVDEMQDTSTSQYDLIARLTRSWDGHSQTVFLVGDPKQSIYRFRQARVERFVRMLHERCLGDLPLTPLRLTANFRSQPRLVRQFNETFAKIFPAAVNIAHPEEVPYVEARAIRSETAADGLCWHVQAVDYEPDPVAQAAVSRRGGREQARAIREIAMQWLGRALPGERTKPWRIAVLVRSRAHLVPIVAEFKRTGDEGAVPFRAVEIEPLGERQEVLDLVSLTRALLHPADRVAWFAILHAPWCGLGLADLHRLAGEEDATLRERNVGELIHQRGHLLSAEGEERLGRVWPVLLAAAAQRGRMPLAERVERTWRTMGGDTYLTAEQRENSARFFRLLDELAGGGERLDLAVLSRRMKKLYAEPAVHAGAVDLVTIHGAKGLEWDVVIVPALERIAQPDRGFLLNWMEVDSSEANAAHVVLAPIPGSGEPSRELNQWIRAVHSMREEAERKRLLYVACTRASEELHLFAAPGTTAKGAVSVDPSSMLKTAWPVAEAYLETANWEAADWEAADREAADWEAAGDEQTFDLAAAGEEAGLHLVGAEGRPPTLYRLPLWFDPAARMRAEVPLQPTLEDPAPSGFAVPYLRPEGSLAARAFGNAVHAFLEVVARRIAEGGTAAALQAEVPSWLPRAGAVLRSAGLAPGVVARSSQRVIDALSATLGSPEGRWILAAHPDAASEYALAGLEGGDAGLRLDRIFRAGATPTEAGADYLWIVDYKTGNHAAAGLEGFLEEQRELYRPQLEAYARTVVALTAIPHHGLRVALFYPTLARITWWVPGI